MALLTGIVAYWKLDEGTGTTTADATGNGATGTLTNTGSGAIPTWVIPGFIGNDLQFNGSTSFVNIPTTTGMNSNTSITVNAWVKFSSLANAYSAVINHGLTTDQWQLLVKSTGKLAIYLKGVTSGAGFVDYDGTGSQTLTTGTWFMLTFVYSSAGLIGYVNAAQDGTATAAGNLVSGGTSATAIGQDLRINTGRLLNGQIDEVGVWSRVLTTTEITQLYNSGAGLQYPFTGTTFQSIPDMRLSFI